jgi:hypothetical protein
MAAAFVGVQPSTDLPMAQHAPSLWQLASGFKEPVFVRGARSSQPRGEIEDQLERY